FFQEFQGSGYSGGSPAEAGRRAYLSRKERDQPFVETICLILPNQNTHRRGRSATIRIFWIKSNHSTDISLPAPTQQKAHNKLLFYLLFQKFIRKRRGYLIHLFFRHNCPFWV